MIEPDGYIAPPLDGIWASAPYFHNGSVPTLWQVLNPASRPKYWRHVVDLDGRIDDNFNDKEVGIEYEIVLKPPTFFHANPQELFNTEAFGKSNQGHDFPDILTMEEKACLLEYLKCL